MGSIPVQNYFFFRLSFRNCLSCVNNCEGLFCFFCHLQFIYVCFICSYSFSHPPRVYCELIIGEHLPVGLRAQLVKHCTSKLRRSFVYLKLTSKFQRACGSQNGPFWDSVHLSIFSSSCWNSFPSKLPRVVGRCILKALKIYFSR